MALGLRARHGRMAGGKVDAAASRGKAAGPEASLDTGAFAPGLYVVRVEAGGEAVTAGRTVAR